MQSFESIQLSFHRDNTFISLQYVVPIISYDGDSKHDHCKQAGSNHYGLSVSMRLSWYKLPEGRSSTMLPQAAIPVLYRWGGEHQLRAQSVEERLVKRASAACVRGKSCPLSSGSLRHWG